MSKKNPNMTSIRNHLSPLVRMRKLVIGLGLIVLTFFLLFGPRFEGDNFWLTLLLTVVAFIAFGFGWAGLSHGLMGWSRHIDFDFDTNEVRQTSATMMGRSKPFTIPFAKIANFEIKEGPLKGEGGLSTEAMIELQDKSGHAMIKAGMFDNRQDAEAVVTRIGDAVAMARKQEEAESTSSSQ